MRPPKLGTLFAVAACLIIAVPASTLATPKIGGHDNGLSIQDERALHVYVDCWDEFKSRCGRNIVDDGLASGNPPTEAKVKDWTATMERWLNPPAPPAVDSPVVVAAAPAATSVSAPASSGDCPSYTGAESSSSTQYNIQGSGAYGCFQVMPGTAASYGCDLSTVDSQVACAAEICADVGATAWESSGMDPCPYVQP